jgi:hypothetical protein
MQAHRRWLRPLGVLLLLPLAGALGAAVVASATCDWECGDQSRGFFVLVLLCTPPATAGVLVFAATARRQMDARTGPGALGRLRLVATRLVIACVVLCALLLATAAIWAGFEGVHELTREPRIHIIGADDPTAYDRHQAKRAGVFWLVVAAVLSAMTIAAALALWAAWQKRRGPSG